MEQARVQEETQMKMDHARRLKQMRHSLEDEKRKRSEESARLRRQLELKQVNITCGQPLSYDCLGWHPPACLSNNFWCHMLDSLPDKLQPPHLLCQQQLNFLNHQRPVVILLSCKLLSMSRKAAVYCALRCITMQDV